MMKRTPIVAAIALTLFVSASSVQAAPDTAVKRSSGTTEAPAVAQATKSILPTATVGKPQTPATKPTSSSVVTAKDTKTTTSATSTPALPKSSATSAAKPASATPAPRKPHPTISPRFVPPPPPVVPTLTSLSGETQPGELIDFMSTAELTEMKVKTETDLGRLKHRRDDMAAEVKDAATRSENFEGLFNEGVISRRELETGRREAERLKEEQAIMDADLADLERRLQRVTAKLEAKTKTKTAEKIKTNSGRR